LLGFSSYDKYINDLGIERHTEIEKEKREVGGEESGKDSSRKQSLPPSLSLSLSLRPHLAMPRVRHDIERPVLCMPVSKDDSAGARLSVLSHCRKDDEAKGSAFA
jgi:hypothetical protein